MADKKRRKKEANIKILLYRLPNVTEDNGSQTSDQMKYGKYGPHSEK